MARAGRRLEAVMSFMANEFGCGGSKIHPSDTLPDGVSLSAAASAASGEAGADVAAGRPGSREAALALGHLLDTWGNGWAADRADFVEGNDTLADLVFDHASAHLSPGITVPGRDAPLVMGAIAEYLHFPNVGIAPDARLADGRRLRPLVEDMVTIGARGHGSLEGPEAAVVDALASEWAAAPSSEIAKSAPCHDGRTIGENVAEWTGSAAAPGP